jgi:HPt (histidine-containing phosphotransfer) domain-containing protein
MNDHLAKPIDPDELMAAVGKWGKPRPADGDGIPQNVSGLDTALGLKRVRGKKSLYLDVLRKFAVSQRDAAGEVRKALAAGDATTAQRAAHTLKGLAGNIGATALQAAAAAVEAGIREKKPVDGKLQEMADLLGPLVSELERRLPRPAAPAAVDTRNAAAVMQQLRSLLQNNDAEAEELVNAHMELLRALMPERANELLRMVNNFDFEKALALLPASAARS